MFEKILNKVPKIPENFHAFPKLFPEDSNDS